MRRSFVLTIFAAGLIAGGLSAVVAEQQATVATTIEGKWKLIAATWYGKESKTETGLIWEFQGKDRFTMRFPGGRTLDGRYQIDTKTKPWQIDVETTEDQPDSGGDGPRMGIASLDGDRLSLCVSGSAGAPRPTEMTSKPRTLNILRILERVK